MAETLFYALSVATVGFAAGVIAARSPMMSVLALLGSFVSLALIYLLAGFQFLAAAQLLVYAGAIMVLFLFVVMLLNLADLRTVAESPTRTLGRPRVVVAVLSAAGLGLAGLIALERQGVHASEGPATVESIDHLQFIAAELFSRYLLPFEATSLLLLATIVGVMVLAKRQRGPT